MSSHPRDRSFVTSRSKEDMSSYRSSPYSSKPRGELDSRKRDSYSSREGSSMGMADKHREPSYSKPNRRSLDERKESYISSSERRDSLNSKSGRDNYPPRVPRDSYSKGGREKEYEYDSRERDSYSPRGERSSFSRGGRGSFSSRGGRDSFQSRGSYGSGRGGRDSFHNRGSFVSMRGNRDTMSSRGSYGANRGNRDSFSRGSYGSPRGGRDSYSSRVSYISLRGGRDSFSSRGRDSYQDRGRGRGSNRGFRGASHRSLRSEQFISHLGTRAQLELTKKLVAHVLEDSEGRGHYREDKPQYRVKDFKREGRIFYRDSDRPYKEDSRNFHYNSSFAHGDKMIKRERPASTHFDKERFMYSEKSKMRIRDKFRGAAPPKRMHDEDLDFDDDEEDDDEGPPLKHPRLSKRGKSRDMSPHAEDFEEEFDRRPFSPLSREDRPPRKTSSKDRAGSALRNRRRSSRSTERVRKKVDEEGDEEGGKAKRKSVDEEEEEDAARGEAKVKRKFSREEEEDDEDYDEDRRGGRETSPSGMQVTIRSDGERAVNSKGHVKSRISGKIFVDLQCPHCPGQRSITFKEYRYHLEGRGHKVKIDKLTYKHSVVLRRIRLQQRNEQREIEEKWEKDSPDEFQTTISRYCNNCKLAFKCLPEDNSLKGIAEHKESKLHKVQERYLFPRCVMCCKSFPSRLAYEYHLASIRHLRIRTLSRENGREGSLEAVSKEDGNHGDKEEMDLTNFITMDSVGEDEEIGSEQEEITGKLEDIEKAEEDAKEGEEGEEEEEDRTTAAGRSSLAEGGAEDEPFEMEVEEQLDHEIDEPEEEEEDDEMCVVNLPRGKSIPLSKRWSFPYFKNRNRDERLVGKEYIISIEAFFCKLCQKAIRTDNTAHSEDVIRRHCHSARHIDNFRNLEPDDFMEEHGEHFEEDLEEEEEGGAFGEVEEREGALDEEVEEEEEEGVPAHDEEQADEDLQAQIEEHGEDISADDVEDEEEEKKETLKDEEDLEREVTMNGK